MKCAVVFFEIIDVAGFEEAGRKGRFCFQSTRSPPTCIMHPIARRHQLSQDPFQNEASRFQNLQ